MRADLLKLRGRHAVLPGLGRREAFIFEHNMVLNLAFWAILRFAKHVFELGANALPARFFSHSLRFRIALCTGRLEEAKECLC